MTKMSRKKGLEIIKDFLKLELPKKKWYQKTKSEIKAIVFYGSTAKGINRANSDLDILVFLPIKIEKKYTTGEYSYFYKKKEINIVIRSIERLRRIAGQRHNAFEAKIFRKCALLYESDSEVRKAIRKISRKPS